jgi:hypothetical protein
VTAADDPYAVFPMSVEFDLDSQGQKVATLTYRNLEASMRGTFSDWVSAYNKDVKLTAPLAESGWLLNVSSLPGGNSLPWGDVPDSVSPPPGSPTESAVTTCNDFILAAVAGMEQTQDPSPYNQTWLTVPPGQL